MFGGIIDIFAWIKIFPLLLLILYCYPSLQAIMRASLTHSSLSVEKFSRWMRAICSILLSRNRPSDRLKALGYIEQAIDVLKSTGNSGDRDEVLPQHQKRRVCH